MKNLSRDYLRNLVYQVNGAAIEVHKSLGAGLLEKVYQKCMEHELKLRNIPFRSQLVVPIEYKGLDVDAELKCDLLVDESLVVEFKAVEVIPPIHVAQLLTYMKLLQLPMGLMINFNVTHIFKEGHVNVKCTFQAKKAFIC